MAFQTLAQNACSKQSSTWSWWPVISWTYCVLWEGACMMWSLLTPPFLGTEGSRGDLFPQLWSSLAVWWWQVFKLHSFIPCSPGAWEVPSFWSSADSVSLGNQQETMHTLLDIPCTHKSLPAVPALRERAGCSRQPATQELRNTTPDSLDLDLWASRLQRPSRSHKAGYYLLSIKHELSRWAVQRWHPLFHYADV